MAKLISSSMQAKARGKAKRDTRMNALRTLPVTSYQHRPSHRDIQATLDEYTTSSSSGSSSNSASTFSNASTSSTLPDTPPVHDVASPSRPSTDGYYAQESSVTGAFAPAVACHVYTDRCLKDAHRTTHMLCVYPASTIIWKRTPAVQSLHPFSRKRYRYCG